MIAIVPAQVALSNLANKEWVDGPVYQDPLGGNLNILYPVKNKDFRQWQLRHQRGGDYIIYTNRKPILLKEPIHITIG